MNLFWETTPLTQAREDHLTCFIAAALEADDLFRTAYESFVLSELDGDGVPQIASVQTQVSFWHAPGSAAAELLGNHAICCGLLVVELEHLLRRESSHPRLSPVPQRAVSAS